MFYVYVAIGAAIFGAGLILAPGLWKVAWAIACLGILMFLPTVLAAVLDPLNTRRIRTYCASVGATDIEIEPFPNHYGVHFRKHDRKHYARCTVVRGRIAWKGPSPADIEPSAASAPGN